MKLRIKGNTIRLRLTKSEIKYFGEFFLIEEETNFGKSVFTYSLKVNDNNNLTASFEEDRLTIFIPKNTADEWLTTNLVGCSGEMDLGNNKKLYLLVEKDFKCLDETIEDQSDNYENPLAGLHK